MKRSLDFLILCFVISNATSLVGQGYNEQFNAHRKQVKKKFEDFSASNDSIFAQHLYDNWKAFEISSPIERTRSKPVEQPKSDVSDVQKNEYKAREIKIDTLFERVKPPKFETYEKFEDDHMDVDFSFYGDNISLKVPEGFFDITFASLDNDGISDFWKELSSKKYLNLVYSLTGYKQKFNLPDYAYLLFLRAFLDKNIDDANVTELYLWFLLNKSALQTKVGVSEGMVTLVLASKTVIYNKPYIEDSGKRYYVLSYDGGLFSSYLEPKTNTQKKSFDFVIKREIKIPVSKGIRSIKYTDEGKIIDYVFNYNKNVASLLSKFPQVEIYNYLNSIGSGSIYAELAGKLKEREPFKAAEMILGTVQKGFPYKSDIDQFGYEKFMYPDEFLMYDYADCDDRSVFFASFIRRLTNLNIVGVAFPNHIATAVLFPKEVSGDYFIYKSKKFTFCDPTYYGAPVGKVIPSADKNKIDVIPIF